MSFFNTTPSEELELFFQLEKSKISYALKLIREENYQEKIISKKNGGERHLQIPGRLIKSYQKKLADKLATIYKPPVCVHSFIKKSKTIKTNAMPHCKKKYVLNLDISNFFDSINFGRVRGILMAKPYLLSDVVATRFAQLVTYKNKLSQGAPSSPIISNMICVRLDHVLMRFAKQNNLFYSRYADDLTFSSNLINIQNEKIVEEIIAIIESNGFQENPNKRRLQKSNQSQKVTGLTVNKKVNLNRKYIRNLRAILHSCFVNGMAEAASIHFAKPSSQPAKYKKLNDQTFIRIVQGKINFLKFILGKNSYIAGKLELTLNLLSNRYVQTNKRNSWIEKINFLDPIKRELQLTEIYDSFIIHVEGKSDITYLKSALRFFHKENKFTNLKLRFLEHDGVTNLQMMYKRIHQPSKADTSYKCIKDSLLMHKRHFFVLDSDTKEHFFFINEGKNDYCLIPQKNQIIERLVNFQLIENIFQTEGIEIDLSMVKERERKNYSEHLRKVNDGLLSDQISPKDNFILLKTKLMKKVNLAKKVSEINLDWSTFEYIFEKIDAYYQNRKSFK
jgi:hypothetical protein